MYEYFNGLVIREGKNNLPTEKIKKLYHSVGWSSNNLPSWQEEKYQLFFENSTWAYTVWDKDEIVAMVRVISDKIALADLTDLIVIPEYQKKGIGKKLVQLCVQKLPHGNWFVHTTSNNYDFYRKCGFSVPDKTLPQGTCTYLGFMIARVEGHR